MLRGASYTNSPNLQEYILFNLIAVLVSSFLLGVAHAAEIADAPIPEPNYIGIILFLVLMVGAGVWFAIKIMSNDKKSKQEQSK